MTKPVIAIKTRPTQYGALVSLGNAVHAGLTGNLDYATPLPALTVLQSNIDDVTAAIAAWGTKGNRGSHAMLVDLRTKSLTLSQTIKSLAEYVSNTAQTAAGSDYQLMADKIVTTGFQLKNPKNPQGILQMVQNFHNFVSRKLGTNQVKLKWKKPLNVTSAGNVKSYKVYKGVTPAVFSTAVVIATVSHTTFTDTNTSGAAQTWAYWIMPVGASVDGVVSDVLVVTVPGS